MKNLTCAQSVAGRAEIFPRAMTQYAPDGGWAEGPGYWHYATSYNVRFIAALEAALGTDFGLARIAGFAEAGWFPLYMTGPLGFTFNFATAGRARFAPRKCSGSPAGCRAEYAAYQRPIAQRRCSTSSGRG